MITGEDLRIRSGGSVSEFCTRGLGCSYSLRDGLDTGGRGERCERTLVTGEP